MNYYNLGAVNQWRKNVTYVTKDNQGLITCKLCNVGPMHINNAKSHFNGSPHAKKFMLIKNRQEKEQDQKKRIQVAESLQPRIDRLGNSKWKRHLQSRLYLYILSPNTGHLTYIRIERDLAEYEQIQMEFTSAVEANVIQWDEDGNLIPRSVERSATLRQQSDDIETCPICIEPVERNPRVSIVIGKCGHKVCLDCVMSRVDANSGTSLDRSKWDCPLCRVSLREP